MSISSQIEAKNPISTVEKSDNLASDFLEIPSCTVEDVDRALFDLFDKDLPLLYTQRNDTRRIPIVFATGERFALIARKKPLRDRSKALILPVISIMRTSVNYGSEFGIAVAPDIRHIIKRQLSKEDAIYQRLVNKQGLQNSDDLISQSAFSDIPGERGAEPGRIATRRKDAGNPDSIRIQSGNLLDPNLGNNIYEIYEIPPPVYFTASYEVTIWTQYMQEMNNVIAVIGTESHFNAKKSFRIETPKGYYFIAYFEDAISNASNFDDFSEEERIVRSTMTVKVSGYFLGQSYVSSPNKIRRYVSSPQVSFDTSFSVDTNTSRTGIPSGNPTDYILKDMLTEEDTGPGQFIGNTIPTVDSKQGDASIGGFVGPQSAIPLPSVSVIKSPFTGNGASGNVQVTKTVTTKQGETTYRQIS